MVLFSLSLYGYFQSKYAVLLYSINMYSLINIQEIKINNKYFLIMLLCLLLRNIHY